MPASGPLRLFRIVIVEQRRLAGVPTARLWQLLAPDQLTHVRLAAHTQLTARDSWTRIHTDLHLLTGPQLGPRARTDLFTWLHQGAVATYNTPSDQLREHLTHLIEMAEPALGPARTRRLRWILGNPTRGHGRARLSAWVSSR